MGKKVIDFNDILKILNQGKTIEEIATEFSINDTRQITDAYDLYCLKNKKIKSLIRRTRLDSIPSENLYDLVKKGYSYSTIAKMYHISENDVGLKLNKYCEENGLVLINKTTNKLTMEEIESINDIKYLIQEFKNGKSLQKIADENNIYVGTLKRVIVKHIGDQEFDRIKNNNFKNRKKWIDSETVSKMIERFEDDVPKVRICEEFGTSMHMLTKCIEKYYRDLGYNKTPKIITKNKFLLLAKSCNYSREEMEKHAKEIDTVIPPRYLDEFYHNEVNIGKIRKFVMSKIAGNEDTEFIQKELFKDFNIVYTLKENKYGNEYQAVALLHSLPKNTNTSLDEISKLVNDNPKIMSALEVLNKQAYSQEDFIEKLKEDEVAKIVQIGIEIEKIRTKNIEKFRIDCNEYSPFIALAQNTRLKNALELAINENLHYSPQYTGEEH